MYVFKPFVSYDIDIFKKDVFYVYIVCLEYIYNGIRLSIFMVNDDDKSERIKLDILKKLDQMNIDRKKSYSVRISLLLEYCGLDKKKFNSWLNKKEGENGRK